MKEDSYIRNGYVMSIYDGDSIRIDIDLGYGVALLKQRIRLKGINAFEITGPEKPLGKLARDFLINLIPIDTPVIVESYKTPRVKYQTGKYGRWIADIYTMDGLHVNKALVNAGHAVWINY